MKNYFELAITEFMKDNNLKEGDEFTIGSCYNHCKFYQMQQLLMNVGNGKWRDAGVHYFYNLLSGTFQMSKIQSKISMTQDEYNFLIIAKHCGYSFIAKNEGKLYCDVIEKEPIFNKDDGTYYFRCDDYDVFDKLFKTTIEEGEFYKIDDLLARAEIKEEKTSE